MDRDGNLAQLAVIPASHKQYVEALLQMPSFFRFEFLPRLTIRAGTSGKVLRLQKACSDHLIFSGHASPLGTGDL